MIGNFDDVAPTPIQLHTVGRLLGWRLGLDRVDPKGTVTLASAGGPNTNYPLDATATLPTIFSHRDVGATDCPGNVAYALLDEIRDTAAHFNGPPRPEDLAMALQGGAIYDRWQSMGGMNSALGAPTSPEATGAGSARYATFDKGAMYWSPETGAEPVTGAIYDAWASLGYERGALGLPTSGEFQEPQWVKQNFQHGTLDFDRLSGRVSRVIDGVAEELPPSPPSGPPIQLERFSTPVAKPIARSSSRRCDRIVAGLKPPAFQHSRHPVVGVGRGHLIGGGYHVGMRVAHRHPVAGPQQHRHVIGHVPERDHIVIGDALRPGEFGDTGGLVDAQRHDLDQPVVGGVGDIALDADMLGELGGHIGAAGTGLADQQFDRRGAQQVFDGHLGVVGIEPSVFVAR